MAGADFSINKGGETEYFTVTSPLCKIQPNKKQQEKIINLRFHTYAVILAAGVIGLPFMAKCEEKVQKITFIEDDAQKNMASKIYVLKHTKAADVAPFIRSAVVRYCDESNVSTVQDGERNRQMLIVSTGIDMIEYVDKLVTALDRPVKVDKASNITGDGIAYGVYQPKFRATKSMLDIIIKGEVSSGEIDSDVRLDTKRNMFYFKDTPATVEDIKVLPLLGWIFSTETEATKRSQLLAVVEVMPADKADNNSGMISKVNEELTAAGNSNSYGYRQYLIDENR